MLIHLLLLRFSSLLFVLFRLLAFGPPCRLVMAKPCDVIAGTCEICLQSTSHFLTYTAKDGDTRELEMAMEACNDASFLVTGLADGATSGLKETLCQVTDYTKNLIEVFGVAKPVKPEAPYDPVSIAPLIKAIFDLFVGLMNLESPMKLTLDFRADEAKWRQEIPEYEESF